MWEKEKEVSHGSSSKPPGDGRNTAFAIAHKHQAVNQDS